MAKHSKRYSANLGKVDRFKSYNAQEGVALLKEVATAKFDETVEVHMRMGVDPRHADQQVRGVVTLPGGTGRSVRILVFATGDGATKAQDAGADFVGAEDIADRIQKGWTDFDVVLATPDMMRVVGRLGRVLGPRGLMPSPKTGTIVNPDDLAGVIQETRLGRVEFRVDKTSNIHVPIGKASFDQAKLLKNLAALMEAIAAARPATLKGNYVHRITITSTMGPGIRLDTNGALSLKVDSV
ncbi:MAG: 50S ribosomal protein L1 [Caldilineaceae bacterium]